MFSNFLLINLRSNDWINLTFILIFVMLVLVKLLYQKRFGLLVSGLFNNKYFSFTLKDSPLVANTFNLMFFPINLLTMSLALYFIAREYFGNLFENYDFEVYLYTVAIVFLFFLLKIIFRNIISVIISASKSVKHFSFYKLSFGSFSSLIIIPFLLIHQYSALDKSTTLTILMSVFIVLLMFQYIYSARLIIARKQYPFLYIFLYLCTLEIIPAVIYIKFVFIVVNNNLYGF